MLRRTSRKPMRQAMFPAAARANKSIFYDRQGNARSVAGVYSELNRPLSGRARQCAARRRADGGCRQHRGTVGRTRRRRRPIPPARPTPLPSRPRGRSSAARRAGVPLAVSESARRAARSSPSSPNCGAHASRVRRSRCRQRSDRDRAGGRRRRVRRSRSISSGTCGRTCAACSEATAALEPSIAASARPLTNHQSFQRFMVNALLNIAALRMAPIPCRRCGTSSWLRLRHDRSSISSLAPYRRCRRACRGHQRVGARLSLFRSVARRSRRDRRRADHAARRSVAAGARGAGAGAGVQRPVAAAGRSSGSPPTSRRSRAGCSSIRRC